MGKGAAVERCYVEEPAVLAAAKAHEATPQQVALAFLRQSGVAAIPKSVHADRMAQNLASLGVQLTEPKMTALAALDTDAPMIGTPQDAGKAKMAMTW